eukprot:110493-Chlamydomonas_euryale.AAC.1
MGGCLEWVGGSFSGQDGKIFPAAGGSLQGCMGGGFWAVMGGALHRGDGRRFAAWWWEGVQRG